MMIHNDKFFVCCAVLFCMSFIHLGAIIYHNTLFYIATHDVKHFFILYIN
jgi:hypothetical protein